MQPTTQKNPESGETTKSASPSTFNPKPETQLKTDPFERERTAPQTKLEREVKDTVHRGAEFVDNAKQTLSEAYDKTGRVMGDAYDRASDAYDKTGRALGHAYDRAKVYGSENPGTMTIVALGVGIGVGILLAQNARPSSRSRARRVVPPVMNALTQVVTELFD